jgi:uncharacterized membrane protein
MQTPPAHTEPLAFERIVFFSDAVFAIAITLLVIEIKVPHIPQGATGAETIQALLHLLPKVIGYVVSFIVLGSLWIEHHRIFRYIHSFDGGLLIRNIAMLLAIAFVPFPTGLFSENYTNTVALAIYAITLSAAGFAKIWVWSYAARGHRLLVAGIDSQLVRTVSWRSWAVPLTSVVVAILAILGWPLAYIGFAFIPLVAWMLGKGARSAVAVILLLVLPAGVEAQGNAPAERYRVAALTDRKAGPDPYWAALAPSLRSPDLRVDTIGRSALGRPLRSVTFGRGPTTVLLWSQMHGDESTASMSLADILRFFAEGGSDPARERIAKSLTVVMVPMLNPDGAERWQRENGAGIDINRDGRRRSTPEGQALKGLRDRLRPAWGFNLHDQGARVRAGPNGQQVAIALLAPAIDTLGTFDPVRERARRLASVMATRLASEIPGRIAKYDDDFNPRAFGDLMQVWGTSTVLIESGALRGDPEKQRLRALNVVAILAALDAIATGSVADADPAVYNALPYNTSGAYDILVRGATVLIPGQPPVVADLAANYTDAVARTGPRLREVGDLQEVVAFDTIDARGRFIRPRPAMLQRQGTATVLQLGAPFEYDLTDTR